MRSLYLLLITAANVLTAKFAPFCLFDGALIVPVGSVFAGAVFVLRDLVQLKHGQKATYRLIVTATGLSAGLSLLLGDTVHVALASVLAFCVSEVFDTEIFSRLQRSLATRVLLSGIVGGCIDSAIFVLIGLSPLGANTLPWSMVLSAMIGQMLSKTFVQLPAAFYVLLRKQRR